MNKMIKERLLSLFVLLLITFNILVALNLNTIGVSALEYPAVYIEPALIVDESLTPGKNFTVSIKTNYTGNDIQSWQFHLSYNPLVLRGVKVTNGDLITIADNSTATATFLPGTFNNTAGKLSHTAAFFLFFYEPAPVTSGPGTLANVTFTVVGIQKSNITLGPETKLIGYTDVRWGYDQFGQWKYGGWGDPYDIIDAETMPDHIGHGYFDNIKRIHDVAVTLDAPDNARLGDLVSINATVTNQGNYTESGTVTVYNDTTEIGTESFTLPSGNRETFQFNWNTTGLNPGTYTINATATIDLDEDLSNNWDTKSIELIRVHDVAVIRVEVPHEAFAETLVTINVTVANEGHYEENVNLTISYGTIDVHGWLEHGIANTTSFMLAQRPTSKTVSLTWNTKDIDPKYTYTINATATIALDENLGDNKNATQTIKLKLGPNVAVTGISAPTEVFTGQLVNIEVRVANIGKVNATFIVKVTYGTNITIGEPQSVTLPPDRSKSVLFNWTTTGVAPGSYKITAKAILDDDIDPKDNLKFKFIDVELPPGTITGIVTDISNGDPIKGANVTANGYSNITDAGGHYMIKVPPDNYTITASAASYHSNSTTQTVISGGTITVNFTLTPLPGTIAGTVTDALTGDSIEGATITANGYSVTTDSEGLYTIQLPPRTYTVTASATKYVSQSETATVTSETTTSLNFTLTPLNGTISGKVTDSSTGEPIAGATVTVDGTSVSTGTDGTYSIEVPPGNYTVTASASGYEDSSETNITVVAEGITTVDFELTPIRPLNILLYAGVAAIAIIIIAAITVYILKFRKPT